ncbi:DUF2752 domain-containing protein [Corallococcus sp. M34]|uniref:DUF2752 domain-containing protein n=1 Tax=Citreicoccus inhibens TaxID=2849499 RepID=UPI001C21AD05|nr:DUF2752 domain-containing protein [Citreicoccus inhibens]MBU8894319.1 DUF2752 domain-containing protein [Citreicoccus inhibens]
MKVTLSPPNRRFGNLDWIGLTGLLGLLIARYIPVAKLIPFWGCVLRQRTGWPCLGCGLTRVADRVAHLNFSGAWEANPLGTVCAVLFGLAAVAMLLHLVFKLPIPEVRLTEREWTAVRIALPVVVLVNYAYVVVHTRFPHWLM